MANVSKLEKHIQQLKYDLSVSNQNILLLSQLQDVQEERIRILETEVSELQDEIQKLLQKQENKLIKNEYTISPIEQKENFLNHLSGK